MKYFTTLFIVLFVSLSLKAQVSCTDCPNYEFLGGILTSEIIVEDVPSDNLALHPLQEICITLDHSWLSDVVISLQSPAGLNYILMGDDDNQWGGCYSSSEDNANICFVLGNGNPLTQGDSYSNYCTFSTGEFCLEGEYTPYCGGMPGPDGQAIPAPNCDINDFNLPGNTVSGTWTLSVYCLCMIEGNPSLVDWSLDFLNGESFTSGGTPSCTAYGGTGPLESQAEVCGLDNEMVHFDAIEGTSEEIPTGDDYGYGILSVGMNGNIVNFSPESEVSSGALGLGTYQLYGVSYKEPALNALLNSIGLPLDDFVNTQIQFSCFNLSENSKTLVVEDQDEIYEELVLCNGEAVESYGESFSSPGFYEMEIEMSNELCPVLYSANVVMDVGVSFEKVYPTRLSR